MAEKRIITKANIQAYFNVPNTVDDSKVNIAILEGQQSNLKQLLGEPFYYAFIENYNGTTFANANYQKLYDGGSYAYKSNTIYFSGIKQLCSCYGFIHIAGNSKINVVRSGVVVKSIEESESAENFEIRVIVRKALDMAARIEREILQYMSENKSLFPGFEYREYPAQRRTAFNFYKI